MRTYIEPVTWSEFVALIIEQAIAPMPSSRRWAGRPRSTCAIVLHRGVGRAGPKFGVELIGANGARDLEKAEDQAQAVRGGDGRALASASATVGHSGLGSTKRLPFSGASPPGFTATASRWSCAPASRSAGPAGESPITGKSSRRIVAGADSTESPTHQVLLIEREPHWLEGVRAGSDAGSRRTTVVIVCSIENIDPMGVHTGDSITVAPAHDSDRSSEYQAHARTRRSQSSARWESMTGGCNIQFAVNPLGRPRCS